MSSLICMDCELLDIFELVTLPQVWYFMEAWYFYKNYSLDNFFPFLIITIVLFIDF